MNISIDAENNWDLPLLLCTKPHLTPSKSQGPPDPRRQYLNGPHHLPAFFCLSAFILSTLTTVTRLLFLRSTRYACASGPLQLLFPLPGILFFKHPQNSLLHLLQVFTQNHIINEASLTTMRKIAASLNTRAHTHTHTPSLPPLFLLSIYYLKYWEFYLCILFVVSHPQLECKLRSDRDILVSLIHCLKSTALKLACHWTGTR